MHEAASALVVNLSGTRLLLAFKTRLLALRNFDFDFDISDLSKLGLEVL